jgi:hypothetical protein
MKQIILLTTVFLVSVLSLQAQEARFEFKSAILKKETIVAGQ